MAKCLLCRLPFIRWLLSGGDPRYRIVETAEGFIVESKGGGRGHLWHRVGYQTLTIHSDAVQYVASLQANSGSTLRPGYTSHI